jgi:hypothetical protein
LKLEGKKIGIVLDEPAWPDGGDIYFHYVKNVTGRVSKPVPRSHNVISCFGDNKTARENAEWICLSKERKATRKEGQGWFYCDWICPSREKYRSYLLKLIAQTSSEEVEGIHLDCLGFPGEEYCVCEECKRKWRESGLNWVRWRQHVVNEFVAQASDLTDKEFSVTLYPDPFHPERFGLDLDFLSSHVSFFVVPIYDRTYLTLYWVEILANAFKRKLKKPFYIGLYAKEAETGALTKAALLASRYAQGTLLAYDPKKAQEVLKILKRRQSQMEGKM